jgi:hypothetical protein
MLTQATGMVHQFVAEPDRVHDFDRDAGQRDLFQPAHQDLGRDHLDRERHELSLRKRFGEYSAEDDGYFYGDDGISGTV